VGACGGGIVRAFGGHRTEQVDLSHHARTAQQQAEAAEAATQQAGVAAAAAEQQLTEACQKAVAQAVAQQASNAAAVEQQLALLQEVRRRSCAPRNELTARLLGRRLRESWHRYGRGTAQHWSYWRDSGGVL
jgi:hypothetical protein